MADMNFKDAQRLVAEQLPGWRIVKRERTSRKVVSKGFEKDGAGMKFDTGPSLAQLRRKFLGVADSADSAPVDPFASAEVEVKTVLIEPTSGGPAKTADIRNGRVVIVQG